MMFSCQFYRISLSTTVNKYLFSNYILFRKNESPENDDSTPLVAF